MADGGAITGVHGREFIKMVLGQPFDSAVLLSLPGGGVWYTSDNPGSQNLPWYEALARHEIAVTLEAEDTARTLLLRNFDAEDEACQGQEPGGYTETWATVRAGLLYRLSYNEDAALYNAAIKGVRRGCLLSCLCNLEGTIAMVGGRAQRCGGHVVQEVCTAMLIGMPVSRSEKWWKNPGNIGALLLGVWLNEHGRDEIFTPRERAELRSWVLHGTVPQIMGELRLHMAVEVFRWGGAGRLVAWTPNGVRSYERDGKSPNHPLVISDLATYRKPECYIAPGGPPVNLLGDRLEVGGVYQWHIPTTDPKTSLSWSGSAWSMSGDETVIETEEAPLPIVSREWLPKGEEMPEPVVREHDLMIARRRLDSVFNLVDLARERVAPAGSYTDEERVRLALDLLDDESTGTPGALQHLNRALAALRGEI